MKSKPWRDPHGYICPVYQKILKEIKGFNFLEDELEDLADTIYKLVKKEKV